MKKMNKRSAVIAGAAAVAVGLGGVAFAAWTADGAGSGTVAAGTQTNITVDLVTITGTLRPGTDADVDVKVTNPGAGQVRVMSVINEDPITSNQAGCDGVTTGVDFIDTMFAINGPLTPPVIAPGATVTIPISNGVTMSNDSVNACQGATFTVPVKVTAETTGA